MGDTLKLIHRPFFGDGQLPDRVVEVEYEKIPHWNTGKKRNGSPWAAYCVRIDGEIAGTVEQVWESTDTHAGRIRIPGKGRLAWGWRRLGGDSNAPGLYERNRNAAVAKLVGNDWQVDWR